MITLQKMEKNVSTSLIRTHADIFNSKIRFSHSPLYFRMLFNNLYDLKFHWQMLAVRDLRLSKNDLFTDSVNMNIHTPLNKFIFFLPNFIFQKAIYTLPRPADKPLPRPADKHKHIKLHARRRTTISGYDRNWLSPFSF